MNIMLKSVSFAAVACAAAVTFAGAAGSAQAGEYRIPVADLDLGSSAGKAAFDARVHNAARVMCESYTELSMNAGCRREVRQEAYDNLAEQQERLARNSDVTMASTHR